MATNICLKKLRHVVTDAHISERIHMPSARLPSLLLGDSTHVVRVTQACTVHKPLVQIFEIRLQQTGSIGGLYFECTRVR